MLHQIMCFFGASQIDHLRSNCSCGGIWYWLQVNKEYLVQKANEQAIKLKNSRSILSSFHYKYNIYLYKNEYINVLDPVHTGRIWFAKYKRVLSDVATN